MTSLPMPSPGITAMRFREDAEPLRSFIAEAQANTPSAAEATPRRNLAKNESYRRIWDQMGAQAARFSVRSAARPASDQDQPLESKIGKSQKSDACDVAVDARVEEPRRRRREPPTSDCSRISRKRRRALCSCDLELPREHPSTSAISLCPKP